MRDVVIVAAARTPIGSFGGSLKQISAIELGKTVVKDVISRINLQVEEIDEVIFGNVLQVGQGQNVARQVSIYAGIPKEVPAVTINKVCGSGLKAVQLAAQAIRASEAEIIIAGGTENMSQAPYILPTTRWGQRMGNGEIVDTLVYDGLIDAFSGEHMGITAEKIANCFQITREQQDQYAVDSQQKAQNAIEAGKFKDEIVPIIIPQPKGEPIRFDSDEYPRKGVTLEKLGELKPAFKKSGWVTAGNASGINDGAAALVVMSKEKADELKLEPLATIKAYANAGVSPDMMGCGPIPATEKALKLAQLNVKDLDLIEANEAFAAQALAVIKTLKLDQEKVNVNGGAISLGHPIGASGARILVSLIYEMQKRKVKTGLATLCIGGGQGSAMIVERYEKS